jgi:hypothetical protein
MNINDPELTEQERLLLEQQKQPTLEIGQLAYLFKYLNTVPMLKGSASKQIFKYFGDYDFMSLIKKPNTQKELYDNFDDIFNRIHDNPNTFFIEFKIQYKDGSKKKFYPNSKIKISDYKNFNQIEFLKIDIVFFSKEEFTEASCIYIIKTSEDEMENSQQILNDLISDVNELKKEKQYFKMLKRFYTIFTNIPKMPSQYIYELINLLNSEYGLMYQQKSRIDAFLLFDKYYKDFKADYLKQRFISTLEGTPKHLKAYYDREINKWAKPYAMRYDKILKDFIK